MDNPKIAQQLLGNGYARHIYVDQKEGKLRSGNGEWKIDAIAFMGIVDERCWCWNIKKMPRPESAEIHWDEEVEVLSLSFLESNSEMEEAVAIPLGENVNIDLALYFECNGNANVLYFRTGMGGFEITLSFNDCHARQILLSVFNRFCQRIRWRWEMRVSSK